jgi:hypothetical protein
VESSDIKNSDNDILPLPFPCSFPLILFANSIKNRYQTIVLLF